MAIYDLNISWTPSMTLQEIDRMLHWAASLGYDTIALNHTITKIPAGEIVNPIPKIMGPLNGNDRGGRTTMKQPFFSPSTTSKPAISGANIQEITSCTPSTAPFPRTVLRRATVVIEDVSQHYRLAQLAAAYDLLAVRPATERAFLAACNTITEAGLISFDFTARLGYYMRAKNVSTAIKRGVLFEVCYSHMLTPPATGGRIESDSVTASKVFGNWEQLFTASRGRGIILSSEAARTIHMRSPAAVKNLMTLYGLPDDKGHTAQTELPRLVVKNEQLRRTSHGGVVQVLEVAKVSHETRSQREDGSSDGAGVKMNIKDETNTEDDGKKRKAQQEAQPQTLSKRAAKRLKKQQMKEAQEQTTENS